jgi:SH3-like domain-containing protein
MIRHALLGLFVIFPLAAGAQPNAEPAKPAQTGSHPAPVKPKPGVHAAGSATAHKAVVAAHPAAAPAPAPVPATPPAPAPPPAAPEPAKGSTGLPLPRFASLKTDEVNLRKGPGLRYPIAWVYKRRDLPVEIEREFEVWRLISDQEGVKGWVHQATLVGRRTFVVTGGEQTMRSDPQDTAAAVARLKPGVIGRLRACEAKADWCQVQVADYRGWLRRNAFWGIYPGEAVQ